jgi:hypothetical protein
MKSSLVAMAMLVSVTALAQGTSRSAHTGRDWYVNPLEILSLTLDEKRTYDTGNTNDTTGHDLTIEAGRNFGEYEVGGHLEHSLVDVDSDKSTTTILGVFGRYNFIPNIDGNDLVPFVRLDLRHGHDDFDHVSTPDTHTDYNVLRLRGGVTYFPFGKLIAVEPYLEWSSRHYDRSAASDYSIKEISLHVPFRIYF